MKFTYFGSSEFSEAILAGLWEENIRPTLVVTKPDKPRGRGLAMAATPVSNFARKKLIPVIKPPVLTAAALKSQLAAENPDLFIVADYGKIIPVALLKIPQVFPICIHPSLLPAYRGPTPIETVLLNAEEETGVTVFKINERIDAGEIILRKQIRVSPDDDFFSLSKKLVQTGITALGAALNKIENNDYALLAQDEKTATLTVKFKKEDGRINWNRSAAVLVDFIRALLAWPTVYTYYKGLRLRVMAAESLPGEAPGKPGQIVTLSRLGIEVATGRNILRINRVQPEGKKIMDAWSFVCGYRLKVGEKFG